MNKLCIQNYRMFLSTIASLGGCIHYSVSHSEVCTQHVTEIMIFPTISTHSLSDNFNTLCMCQTISTHSLCVSDNFNTLPVCVCVCVCVCPV